jgi:hypothetical protein
MVHERAPSLSPGALRCDCSQPTVPQRRGRDASAVLAGTLR